MSRGEIVISEARCKGCGYCVHFCARKCIVMPEGRFNSKGYPQAVVVDAASCTGCGICGWMCPDQAIEVFRYVEAEAK